MTNANKSAVDTLESIIWNNWGIVEVLSDRRETLKIEIIDSLYNSMSDEEIIPENKTSPEAKSEKSLTITGQVKKRHSGRGVETKYFLEEKSSDSDVVDGADNYQTSLGAITIDFPKSHDGIVSLEVSASLPQQRLRGNGLDDSKKFIEKKIKTAMKHSMKDGSTTTGTSDDEVVNIADLDAATGRNDIAKRIVYADPFNNSKGEEGVIYNIDEFLDSVMKIYDLYTQIPRWLAEIPKKDT